MTQIICVGDLHLTDRPPVNATESYTDDIIDMLTWTTNYAVEHGIRCIVWAGDIFHHKSPARTSHALVQRVMNVAEYARSQGIEIVVIVGNHDITNDRLDSLERQPLGVLAAAGLIRLLDGWHPELPLFGVPWRQDWTTNEVSAAEAFQAWRDEPEKWSNREHALAVTHAPIYPPGEDEKQMFELVPVMGIDGLSYAMGNKGYLYYGHIHEDHGIFEFQGVTYCNVGALSRGSLTEYNIERQIKIAVWDSETGFTEVVVPHKPASEVFKIEQATERKQDKLDLDQFLSDIGSTTIDITSVRSVIESISGRPDVNERVKRHAIAILEELE